MRMAVHFYVMLLQIVFLFGPIKSFGQSVCPSYCGNFGINYPFGLRGGCYSDKRFQVICNFSNGDHNKAFLPSINNLQVLDGPFDGSTIRVNIPVISSSNVTKGINLTGSPFTFSAAFNRFAAIGCDDQIDYDGCLSINKCGPSENKSACYDFLCYISPNITQVFDVNLSYFDSQSTRGKCRFAFMVEENWIFSEYLTNPRAFRNEVRDVPAILDWGEIKGTCLEEYSSNSKFCNGTRCSIPLSFGHTCRCSRYSNQDGYCSGTLICTSDTSRSNCSRCPYGYFQSGYNSRYYNNNASYCYNLFGPYNWFGPYISPKSRVKYIIVGCFSGGLGLVFVLIGMWWSCKFVKRKKEIKMKQKFFKRNGGMLLQQDPSSNESRIGKIKLFTSKELEKATDNYSTNRILGQGGQGTVYKGMLVDGRCVAVKKSKLLDESNVEQFINEVAILSQINHRNIVKILGCCLETEVPLLVYEFIPNGTLYQYIHNQIEEFPVTWETLLRIVVEVSSALFYLHSAASIPIYHRDIKSANILLDDKYRAKVSDFGTSKSITVDQTHLTTAVKGTFGYLDPEYFRSSQFTDKSDVYSFGVVLAEILTGQKPIRPTESEVDRSLVTYFLQAMKENRLFDVVDARVLKEAEKEEIITVAMLAKRCLNLNGKKRPTMKEVAFELGGIRASIGAPILQQNYGGLNFVNVDGDGDGDNTGHYFKTGSSSTGTSSFFETGSSSTGTSSLKSATFSINVVPLLSNEW